MLRRGPRILTLTLLCAGGVISAAAGQTPPDYQGVLTSLARSGDFKDDVLKVNIPRNDLKVTIEGRGADAVRLRRLGRHDERPPAADDVMMGDLVLIEDEVNPVMSALLDNGLEVTALHNHFFLEQPRIFYMHVHGMGTAADLAQRLKPALALIPKPPPRRQRPHQPVRRHSTRRRSPRRSGTKASRAGRFTKSRSAALTST